MNLKEINQLEIKIPNPEELQDLLKITEEAIANLSMYNIDPTDFEALSKFIRWLRDPWSIAFYEGELEAIGRILEPLREKPQ